MRLIVATAFAIAASTAQARMEPAHGTQVFLTFGGEAFAVMFWPVSDKVMVSRDVPEVGKGAFPAGIAAAIARAALDQVGMSSCTLDAPELYMDVPGLWDVFYSC